MQQRQYSVTLLATIALVVALSPCLSAGEEATAFVDDVQGMQYGRPLRSLPGSHAVVPGPPIPPIQASRPASWPGTPAPPKQWSRDGESSAGRGSVDGYQPSSPPGYPEGTAAPAYPSTGASAYYPLPYRPAQSSPYQPPPDDGSQSPRYQPLPYDPSQPPPYRLLPYDPSQPPDYVLEPHRPPGPPAGPPREPYPADPPREPYPADPSPPPSGFPGRYPQPPHVAQGPIGGPPQGQFPGATQMEPCEGVQILGWVGPEMILASEVMPAVNELIAQNIDRISPDQLETQRRLLTEQRLKIPIETKLIYLDARRAIPEENFPRVEKSLSEQFEKHELKKMMQKAGVQTRQELDQKLRSMGTSLERTKQAFVERALAQTWVRQQLDFDEEVTYGQMLEYYRQHPAEFERPARVRWEELMVRFSEHPDKAEAYAAIAEMGNRVLAGVPLAEVAKSRSDGTTASEGGLRDWTTKGSLVCEVLDQALFGLPMGRLSPILEGKNGFHIVRVIEREPDRWVPFREAQVEIGPKIRRQRIKEGLQAYVARLKEQIPVWTIFDERPRREEVTGRGSYPRR